MGEKGNVAAGASGVGEQVVGTFEAVGASAGDIGQTVAVGVVTAVAAEEAKKRRAGADDKDEEGGPEATDKREM